MSDDKVLELMRQLFLPSSRYHKHTSYALKHVLQQADERFYLPEGEFIRLLGKAGYSIKPTKGMSYKVKVWVIPDERVNKTLWGKGNELKYIENG